MNYSKELNEETKKAIINDYLENFLSIRDIMKKYGIRSRSYLADKLLLDVKRTPSEALRIAHKKYPESFKLTEESKDKIRRARLKFMKEYPEQTAWRQKNISFPEKCFKLILEENGYDKRFLIYREYSVYPYYIDYAFVDIKVAVEIDGSQHLERDRKESDERKDELLISKGWRVIRFTASDVMYNKCYVIDVLNKFITTTEVFTKVGILKSPTTYTSCVYCDGKPKYNYKKKERDIDGYTKKQKEKFIRDRKVKDRPSKEELFEMLKNQTFEEIGRKYGVDGNSIRHWCRQYGIPSTRKEYDKITNKERKYAFVKHICKNCGKEYFKESNSVCCSKKCFNEYIKEHYHEHYHNTSIYFVYKIMGDSNIKVRRVKKEEIEEYLSKGWNRGRKPKG